MTDILTTTERVNAWADRLERLSVAADIDPTPAHTLRRLAAERDALLAELDRLRELLAGMEEGKC